MAEAIFAKYSKSTGGGSINSSTIISNSTKAAFGLGPNATLDDCLMIVGLKNPDTATIQVTLKDIDGSPLGGHQIRMQDRTGFNLVYTTDGAGSCIFTTVNAQATFYDESNNGWFDVGYPNSGTIDLPNGIVKTVTLQRYKRLNNGDTITLENGVKWYNFSKYTKSGNVYLQAPSGGNSYWDTNILHLSYWLNTYNKGNAGSIDVIQSGTNFTITGYGAWAGVNNSKKINLGIQPHISTGKTGQSKWANNVNLEGNFRSIIYQEGTIGITSNSITQIYPLNTIGNNPNYNKNFFLANVNIYLKSNGSAGTAASFGNQLVVNGGAGGTHSQGSSILNIHLDMTVWALDKRYVPVNGNTYNIWLPRIMYSTVFLNKGIAVQYGWGYISNFQYK